MKTTRPTTTPASSPACTARERWARSAWCFPDYHESLWGKPPCDFQAHERFFGLWRPDGSLKPMGQAVARFRQGRAEGA